MSKKTLEGDVAPSYRGYRFPPAIISHAVWLYYRFGLSFLDVEDLLAERGITVTYEAIRLWCLRFGLDYARRLRHRRGRQGDTWHLDELFVRIQGRQQYLGSSHKCMHDSGMISPITRRPKDEE